MRGPKEPFETSQQHPLSLLFHGLFLPSPGCLRQPPSPAERERGLFCFCPPHLGLLRKLNLSPKGARCFLFSSPLSELALQTHLRPRRSVALQSVPPHLDLLTQARPLPPRGRGALLFFLKLRSGRKTSFFIRLNVSKSISTLVDISPTLSN